MRMRTYKSLLFAAMMVAGMAFVANSWATEDIRNTKHNLFANPNIQASMGAGTTGGEVCVFCHTPHGGDTAVGGGSAPLWNRNLSKATYQTYTSPNFDAEGVTAGTPKGVSLACLSCHDGTVALDSLLNLPGSGGGPGSASPISFSGSFVDVDKTFKEGVYPPDPFPNLGNDLRNDHPISMKIPIGDPQFDEIRANLDAGRLTGGKVAYLWRGADAKVLPTDPRDRIRAYPTQGGDAYIECASCHNPHEMTGSRFLRYPSASDAEKTAAGLGAPGTEADRNKGSLVCLTCHQK